MRPPESQRGETPPQSTEATMPACKGFFAAKIEKNCLNFITVHAACSDKIPYLRRLLN